MFQTPVGKGDSSRSLDTSPTSAATSVPSTPYNPRFKLEEKTTPPKAEPVAKGNASTQTQAVDLYKLPADVVYTAAQLKGPPYGPYAGIDGAPDSNLSATMCYET